MKVSYFGHACFLVEIGNKSILFDPFIKPNPLASKVNISQINPDYILLSHAHNDHIADLEEIAKQSNAEIVSIYEISSWLEEQNYTNQLHGMNIGGTLNADSFSIKMVSAMHSSTLPDGKPGGVAAGYVIKSMDKTMYFAGDTALTYDMKLIGEEFDIDFAILPIGGYFTMDISDAVKAADFVKTDKIVGMHYDSFPPIEIDHVEAQMVAKTGKKELMLIEIGNNIRI